MANTIRVNLSAVGNACDQDVTPAGVWPAPGWYAFLYNCDVTPFVHAKKEYGPFAIDHGYVEIRDVPKGRYVLFAIVNPFPVVAPVPGGEAIFQANFASHFAVVDICDCCSDICVTLYNSGWHYCVQVILYWFELQELHGQIDRATVQAAREALQATLKFGGPTLPGDAGANAALERMTREIVRWHETEGQGQKRG